MNTLFAFVLFSCSFAAQNTMKEVVELLQKMQKDSQVAGEKDQREFALTTCECNTDKEDARNTIKETTEEIALLEAKKERLLGANGKLSQEIAALNQGIRDNKQQRKELTNVRDEENEAYTDKKADLEAAIEQLKGAISELADIGADQTAEEGRDTADTDRFMKKLPGASLIRQKVQMSMKQVEQLLPAAKRDHIASLLSYAPASGEIVGILKNMKDTFEQDRTNAIEQEKRRLAAYEALMEQLKDELSTMREMRANKKTTLGENSTTLSNVRKNIAANTKTQQAAEKTLAERTAECAEDTKQYEGRKATRAEEAAAIAEAIAIFNSDNAFANEALSGAGNFVQISLHSARLQKVQRLMASGPFQVVVDEIDKMLAVIDKEAESDAEKKAFCEKEREVVASTKAKNEEGKQTEEGNLATAKSDLDIAIENIQKAVAEIKSLKEKKAAAIEARQAGNQEYQRVIADNEEAAATLKKGINVLERFYAAQSTEDSEADNNYERHEGGAKVLGMLEKIVGDVKQQEKEAHEQEETSQQNFETTVTENNENQALQQSIKETETEAKDDATNRKLAAQEMIHQHVSLLQQNEEYHQSIDPGCTFMEEQFDFRERARGKESTALKEARDKMIARQTAHAA